MKNFATSFLASLLLMGAAQAQNIQTAELVILSGGGEQVELTGLAGHGLRPASTIEVGKTYSFVSRFSGKCLDVADHSLAALGEIQQWDCHYGPNQTFKIVSNYKWGNKIKAVESDIELSYYSSLQDTANGAYNGRPLIQNNVAYTNNFSFSATIIPGIYSIKEGNLCIDIKDWSTNNGGRIQGWECHGGHNQQWIVLEHI